MSAIQPQYPASRRWHPTWRDVNSESQLDDSLMAALEARIMELERALTDRRYRRHVRREIRRSQAAYAWAGSWRWARIEATTWQWEASTGAFPAEFPEKLPADMPAGDR